MIDETTDFFITANKDLLTAQIEENYEQCSLIQTAIYLYIQNISMLLADATGANQKDLFQRFKDQSDYCFQSMLSQYESQVEK